MSDTELLVSAESLVSADLKVGLREVGFEVVQIGGDSSFPVSVDQDTQGRSAIGWSVTARHVGDFEGIAATNAEVLIEGITIVDCRNEGSDGVVFWRVVNWIGVYGQLGVTTSGRSFPTAKDGVDPKDQSTL